MTQKNAQIDPSIYEEHGYLNRDEWLKTLAEENCVPLQAVELIAESLGPDEDFDGLIATVEDLANDEGVEIAETL